MDVCIAQPGSSGDAVVQDVLSLLLPQPLNKVSRIGLIPAAWVDVVLGAPEAVNAFSVLLLQRLIE